MRLVLLSCLAMTAFAANSVLCRLALAVPDIDAASFTSIRLVSGAGTLWLLTRSFTDTSALPWDVRSACWLFAYALLFSFAYLSLRTGTGALILFASVQLTMLSAGFVAGERHGVLRWSGFLVSAAGLVYLVLPGVSSPPLGGALLMAGAGISWGFYSLRGKRVSRPIAASAANFIVAALLAVSCNVVFLSSQHMTVAGTGWAVASGALASGLGYVIWYTVLPGLSAFRAASMQLSVPVLAAFGGVLLLAESLTLRLVIASVMTLGGIALTLLGRR